MLNTCSLVCKAWVPRSQQLIHAVVDISFKHLKTRVDAALPLSVARYVKAIRLHGKVEVDVESTESWDVLSHFPNIHRITFELLFIGVTFSFPLTLNLPSIFAHTTHLIILNTYMQDYDVWHRFLLCFPALTHLDVGSPIPFVRQSYNVPPLAGTALTQHPLYDSAKAFASRIQSLTIYLYPYFNVVLNLGHLLPFFTLGYCSVKHLSLTQLSRSGLPHLVTLLATFSRTLEKVEIPVYDSAPITTTSRRQTFFYLLYVVILS